jgi:uncharacterized membrane protein
MTSLHDPRGTAETPSRDSGNTARLLALVALTALASALWCFRASYAGARFSFLFWNLFLAWVPWFFSTAMQRSRWRFWPLATVWLAFFPNAPYLLTDLVHLKPRDGAPLMFDVLLFSAFALTGCALGWDSLSTVHQELQRRWGATRAMMMTAACVMLTGVGVFLGRFARLNSWELFTDPLDVLHTARASLLEPHALVFSIAFAGLFGAGYVFSRRP